MKKRHGIVALSTALGVMVGVPSDSAAAGPPQPIRPDDGAALTIESPIIFQAFSRADDRDLWMEISLTDVIDSSDGTLLDQDVIARDELRATSPGEVIYSWTWDPYLMGSGTYFWQPFRFDCFLDPDCFVEGEVHSFTVVDPSPPPPPPPPPSASSSPAPLKWPTSTKTDPPEIEITKPGRSQRLRRARFRKVRGIATDASGIKEVRVGFLLQRGKHCYSLTRRRMARGSCKKVRLHKARGKSRWSYRLNRRQRRALRRGKLYIYAEATDKNGNRSKPVRIKVKLR